MAVAERSPVGLNAVNGRSVGLMLSVLAVSHKTDLEETRQSKRSDHIFGWAGIA
jgi:hypothetical protein